MYFAMGWPDLAACLAAMGLAVLALFALIGICCYEEKDGNE